MKRRCFKILVAIFFSGFLLLGTPILFAKSMSTAEFYKENTLTLYIGYSAGGGTDYTGRLFAKYWEEVVDGGTVIVKNMGGAAGIVAANYVNSKKADGLSMVIGLFAGTYVLPKVTADKAARYDSLKLNYIFGGMHEPWVIHVSAKKPYETIEDLKKAKNLKLGTISPYSGDTAALIPFPAFLDLDVKLITGFKGGSASLLAAGKGEIDLVVAPASVGLRAVKKGFLKPAIVIMDYKRTSIFPETPTITEVIDFTPEQETLFEISNRAGYLLRVGAVAPDVSPEKVKFLRDAFIKITKLPAFQKEAFSKFPLGPTPVHGAELQKMVQEAATMDFRPVKSVIDRYLAIR